MNRRGYLSITASGTVAVLSGCLGDDDQRPTDGDDGKENGDESISYDDPVELLLEPADLNNGWEIAGEESSGQYAQRTLDHDSESAVSMTAEVHETQENARTAYLDAEENLAENHTIDPVQTGAEDAFGVDLSEGSMVVFRNGNATGNAESWGEGVETAAEFVNKMVESTDA